MRRKNAKNKEIEENFYIDEIVDITNENKEESYEGKILGIKDDKIIVFNINKNREESYDRNGRKVIKAWGGDRPLQIYNRVDLELKDTSYWVEGVVLKINEKNNEVLVKYQNSNRYKRIQKEWIDLESKRIYPVGMFTKYDKQNNLQSSNLSLSKSEININKNFLGKKTKNNNSTPLNEEQEIKFQKIMENNNFLIKKVVGDGNCMFRAFSDQVYGSEKYHNVLREKCMDYLVVQKRFFAQFIEGDFDSYINEKRKDGIWGDDIELEALSEIYNRPIEIYSGSEKPLRCFHEDKKLYLNNTNKGIIITPIRLSYHGRKHYNSIIPMKDDTNKYRDYIDNIIRTKPGEYEKKIISFAKDNEERLDKGIQLSEEEYRNYLKKLFSGKKNEEILDEIILKLNKINEKIHDIKKVKHESSKKENNKNNQDKDDSKIEEKRLEKEEKKEEIKKEKNNENGNNKDKKNNENNEYNDNDYLNNPIIKYAIELGFDLDSAILAWSKYEDNKELAINYLISMKEPGKAFGE